MDPYYASSSSLQPSFQHYDSIDLHSLLDEREGSLLSQRQRSYIEEQHELITELRARLGRLEEELHAREAEVDDLRATRPSQAKYFDLEEKYRALREENREVRNRLQDATEAGQNRQNDLVATLESQLHAYKLHAKKQA